MLEIASEELLIALRGHEPEDPSWNFTGEDRTVGFLARRFAHELAIHRVDAELVRGRPSAFDREMAVDGIDERLEVMLPFMLGRAGDVSLAGSVCLVCSDDPAAWTADVDHGVMRFSPGARSSRRRRGRHGVRPLLLRLEPTGSTPVGGDRTTGRRRFLAVAPGLRCCSGGLARWPCGGENLVGTLLAGNLGG